MSSIRGQDGHQVKLVAEFMYTCFIVEGDGNNRQYKHDDGRKFASCP